VQGPSGAASGPWGFFSAESFPKALLAPNAVCDPLWFALASSLGQPAAGRKIFVRPSAALVQELSCTILKIQMIRNGMERDSPLIAVAPETSIWHSSRNIRSAQAEQSIRILLRSRSFAELWSQMGFSHARVVSCCLLDSSCLV